MRPFPRRGGGGTWWRETPARGRPFRRWRRRRPVVCCARRPQRSGATFARDVFEREAADPLLDKAAARLSIPLVQPLTPGSAVTPGGANGKRVATPRTPRRQAGWRPVTGCLLARHNLPGEGGTNQASASVPRGICGKGRAPASAHQSGLAAARAGHQNVYGAALDRRRRCAPAGVRLGLKLGPRGSRLHCVSPLDPPLWLRRSGALASILQLPLLVERCAQRAPWRR